MTLTCLSYDIVNLLICAAMLLLSAIVGLIATGFSFLALMVLSYFTVERNDDPSAMFCMRFQMSIIYFTDWIRSAVKVMKVKALV